MKYIAIIGIGLVLLLMICGVVLWANMPTAKLTVSAVRPMGTNLTWHPSAGQEQSSPVWEAAITNTGRTHALWWAYIHFKDGEHEWADTSPWFVDQPSGELAAGKSATMHIIVPSDTHTNWALTIKYWPSNSPVETKLYGWLKPVPKLRSLLPNSGDHFAASTWHTGTNVTTAR